MIEPRKSQLFSDLAAASVLLVKYRALARLVADRQRYVSAGCFQLEGVEREDRRRLQMRLARQFPGSLAELEGLCPERVSALIEGLRSILEGETSVSDEGLRVVHAVHDYHMALHVMLTGEDDGARFLPSSIFEGRRGGGASRRVGSWVREKYGLADRCQVWIFDIGWIRGREASD